MAEAAVVEDFVAYNSRWRLALLLFLSTGFVSAGLWMGGAFGPLPDSRRYSTSVIFIVGWLCVVLFGLSAVAAVMKLFDTSEQVRIGPAGIRPSAKFGQIISWSDIEDVIVWRHKRQKFLVLKVRDPARFPQHGIPAFMARANKALTGGDIVVNLTGTDRRFDDAWSAIHRFRR